MRSPSKVAFSGKLIICNGAELGQAVYDLPVTEKLLNTMNYDIVIGSIHNLPNVQDFYYMDFSGKSKREDVNKYTDGILRRKIRTVSNRDEKTRRSTDRRVSGRGLLCTMERKSRQRRAPWTPRTPEN